MIEHVKEVMLLPWSRCLISLSPCSRSIAAPSKLVRMASNKAKSDWEPTRYLRFEDERTRPARDLLAQIPVTSPKVVVDLGCGPGNSTELLAARYPSSRLIGMDSSSAMVEKARTRLPDIAFETGDLCTYQPDAEVDLFYSNAVFQWVAESDRVPAVVRLLREQRSQSVFAFQVPDNFDEPSHVAMRETAADGWQDVIDLKATGNRRFPSASELYNAFQPLCSKVDLWHTSYQHRLVNAEAIVDWLRSTGLRPFLDPLNDVQRSAFLDAYLVRIKKAYAPLVDGGVLLRFPRLFCVLTRR